MSNSVTVPERQNDDWERLDVVVADHGSVVLVHACTPEAEAWIAENVPREGYQPYWPSLVCEPRYVAPLLEGMRDAGLTVGG